MPASTLQDFTLSAPLYFTGYTLGGGHGAGGSHGGGGGGVAERGLR